MESPSSYQTLLVSLAIVCALVAGTYVAYEQGMLDPLIEKMGVMAFKAKAEAEKKEMQAEGMKAGEDFVDSQLRGNQQAADVAEGVGSMGGLKKQL